MACEYPEEATIEDQFDQLWHRFRWVSLQIQNICDTRRFKLEEDIRREIGKLPKTLEDSYNTIYDSIQSLSDTAKLVAKRVISWLLCAQWRLGESLLRAAITINGPKEPITKDQILDICCNFVVYDNVSRIFRFAHLSGREYLESRPEYSRAEIHFEACYACLNTWNIPSVDRKDLSKVWLYYATQYLLFHLEKLEFATLLNPSHLDDSLQRFIRVDGDIGLPYLDWAKNISNTFYFGRGSYLDFSEGKVELYGNWTNSITLSHPLSLFAALENCSVLKRTLQTCTLRLSQSQRDECVEAAALRSNITGLKLLLSNGFTFPIEVIPRLLKHIPRDLPGEQSKDLEHLLEEIIAFAQKTSSSMRRRMVNAARQNSSALFILVRHLYFHRPELKFTQQRFEDVAVVSRDAELCRFLLSEISELAITPKIFQKFGLLWRQEDSGTCICTLLSLEANAENFRKVFEALATVYEEPGPFQCLIHRTKFEKDWTVEPGLRFEKDWIIEQGFRNAKEADVGGKKILSGLLKYDTDLVMKHAPLDVMAKLADPQTLDLFLSLHRDTPVTVDDLVAAAMDEKEHALVKFQSLLNQKDTNSQVAVCESIILINQLMTINGGVDFMKLSFGQHYFPANDIALQCALWAAAAKNDSDMACFLLDIGVDAYATNRRGHTAIQIASRHGNFKLAEQLRMMV